MGIKLSREWVFGFQGNGGGLWISGRSNLQKMPKKREIHKKTA